MVYLNKSNKQLKTKQNGKIKFISKIAQGAKSGNWTWQRYARQ